MQRWTVGWYTRAALALAVGSSPALAAAQQPTPRAELVVLGSGGPRMTGRAASSNAIVLDGKARILVDAGTGAAVRLGEVGLDIEDLDTILLTHLHIDHSGDLPGVAKARGMTHHGPMTFRVFGPAARSVFPSTTGFIASLFDAHGIFAYQRTFGAEERFAVTDLPIDLAAPAREILREGNLRIGSIATNHGEAPSVAYRIDGPGWRIAFSGDLDPSGLPNLTRLATGVDLLIFNCAVLDPPGSPRELYTRHTAPSQIGEVARGRSEAAPPRPHPAARGDGLPRGAGVGGRGLFRPGGAGPGPDAGLPHDALTWCRAGNRNRDARRDHSVRWSWVMLALAWTAPGRSSVGPQPWVGPDSTSSKR